MSWEICVDPEILGGKPVIKGTRIPVELIFELSGIGYSIEQIIEEYPYLTLDAVKGILELGQLALENLSKKKVERAVAKEGAN
ncbi:MAG: DUF433 domain-containing protein [Candidatus Heimdallarchaeota archaeon]